MPCRPVLLLALALGACVTASGDSGNGGVWEGHHLNDLILAWGPPSAVERLDGGQRVITYIEAHDGGTPAVRDLGQGVTVVHGSGSYQCRAIFRTDSGGRITGYDVEGTVGGCDRLFGDKPGPAG